jgi:hypothetical protein
MLSFRCLREAEQGEHSVALTVCPKAAVDNCTMSNDMKATKSWLVYFLMRIETTGPKTTMISWYFR